MFLHLTTGRRAQRLGAGFLLSLGVALVGCGGDQVAETTPTDTAPVVQADAPVVVATTSILCDLTEQIAETTVALTCLLEPGVDPHTYQVRPSDRQAIEQANLVFYGGYDFAPSISSMVEDSTTGATRVAVYEAAMPNPLMGEPHDHDHDHGAAADDHGHDQGHDHGHDHGHDDATSATADADLVPDPHIWHNASNNGAIAAVIADYLAQVNPDQANLYAENADRLAAQFDEIDGWIQTQVATVPADQRQLVTTHDAFGYFADAYGFEVKGALSGLSTEEQPTPGAMTALVDQVKSAEVPAIFAEDTTNPRLIETVARDAGVAVAEQPLFVEGPGGPGSGAETTQAMLVVNTCTIVDALGGSCDRTSAPL
jgi:manganese/iron transport system substrate-binding protein